MKIQVNINIDGTKENVWKVITDIEGSVNNITEPEQRVVELFIKQSYD